MSNKSLEYQSDLNIIRMSKGDISRMTSSQRIRFLKLGIIYRRRGARTAFRGTRYAFTEKGERYLEEAIPVDKT